ncbi:MAG: 3-phosphoshikimate 1-carboxyvinyltransferase [Lactobacillales bacterium]|jgi:3-phosphoshikimate 1-carboxyvinyltransferase|nr:3-phosphoshikimate 1-carboxyvinyltransferase [Lactobacillales bacterium]
MKLKINSSGLRGELTVPADKSISHRSIMFGSIAHGKTTIKNFLRAEDCLSTLACFRQLGVEIEDDGEVITVHGQGFEHLVPPFEPLDAGNSGTTVRLMSGILATLDGLSTDVIGDASLSKRPMLRIKTPLELMGASVSGQGEKITLPITVKGTKLKAIHYDMPVASAQVKSAILLAGLNTPGETSVREDAISRNHTEEMINYFGGHCESVKGHSSVIGPQRLEGRDITVPGDISSAAFWIVAGLIVPGSEIILRNVGINETRTGIIDVVKAMGGDIKVIPDNELTATIVVRYSDLNETVIEGEIIPRLIDELPVIALLATQAKGDTMIRDAHELRVKETDRITAVATELRKLGASIDETEDGMIIHGKTRLNPVADGVTELTTYHDHRIGMMNAIAALLVDSGKVELTGEAAINISYPTFFDDLDAINHSII